MHTGSTVNCVHLIPQLILNGTLMSHHSLPLQFKRTSEPKFTAITISNTVEILIYAKLSYR